MDRQYEGVANILHSVIYARIVDTSAAKCTLEHIIGHIVMLAVTEALRW